MARGPRAVYGCAPLHTEGPLITVACECLYSVLYSPGGFFFLSHIREIAITYLFSRCLHQECSAIAHPSCAGAGQSRPSTSNNSELFNVFSRWVSQHFSAIDGVQELEEDPELRQQVTLYKNTEALGYQYQPPTGKNAFAAHSAAQSTSVAQHVDENAAMEGASDAEAEDGEDEDVDAAALDIPLDELLDDLEGLNMEDEE